MKILHFLLVVSATIMFTGTMHGAVSQSLGVGIVIAALVVIYFADEEDQS